MHIATLLGFILVIFGAWWLVTKLAPDPFRTVLYVIIGIGGLMWIYNHINALLHCCSFN